MLPITIYLRVAELVKQTVAISWDGVPGNIGNA